MTSRGSDSSLVIPLRQNDRAIGLVFLTCRAEGFLFRANRGMMRNKEPGWKKGRGGQGYQVVSYFWFKATP